jgi:hypothetical protein
MYMYVYMYVRMYVVCIYVSIHMYTGIHTLAYGNGVDGNICIQSLCIYVYVIRLMYISMDTLQDGA